MQTQEYNLSCSLTGVCSGCAWIDLPYPEQLERKAAELAKLMTEAGVTNVPKPEMLPVSGGATRDRVDVTIQRRADGSRIVGLHEFNSRDVVDMTGCPQMSPALETWFREFRASLPDIRVGSVRLRVSPGGRKGAWLDFANVDIKACLDEKSWLTKLLEVADVEMGQRRKRLDLTSNGLKLTDPRFENWFETYLGPGEKPAPLYCSIASFTQPGFNTNRVLVRAIRATVLPLAAESWLELFCGIGNFTLPLISWNKKVTALEIDEGALEGLRRTLNELGWDDRVKVVRSDLYRKNAFSDLSGFDGVVVDPPRSGLKNTLDVLMASPRKPKYFVYVSCFTPTLAKDAAILQNMGYTLESIKGVDQFPQTPHCEWVCLFKTV